MISTGSNVCETTFELDALVVNPLNVNNVLQHGKTIQATSNENALSADPLNMNIVL